MEKLLYEEKNIGSARKIVIGICAGIFLLIGILIFCFDAQIPDISYYSGTKTALTGVRKRTISRGNSRNYGYSC